MALEPASTSSRSRTRTGSRARAEASGAGASVRLALGRAQAWWDGEWNARVKDRLERKLQLMVCAGEITLSAARSAIESDWQAAYRQSVAPSPSVVPRDIAIEEDEVGR